MLYFNGFMSAFFTSNLESIIGNGGLIPLNAFTNDNDFTIGKLLRCKCFNNCYDNEIKW
ncbi:hypothetical protein [Spiroplasma endosymbiont of Cleonymus obscurus]|uniref:hypothetical protein n=1 Tax=Spiroplasma endosymbiont of Cleonymus obscurus TaxID=3066324 RepID=UPI0037DD8658